MTTPTRDHHTPSRRSPSRWFATSPRGRRRNNRALLDRIDRPLTHPHRITITSIKGGVGKTTVSACLATTLAECRRDRVVALDANTHAGTLYERVTGQRPTVTVQHFLDDLVSGESLTSLGAYLTLTDSRLSVMAAAQNPRAALAFGDGEYDEVVSTLERFYNVIVTDCGTGLADPVMTAVLAQTDTLIVVANPTVDSAVRADATLDAIEADGHTGLAADAIAVLSHDRISTELDITYLRQHFQHRCRALIEIPADPHLEHGGRIDPDRLQPATHAALLALADQALDSTPEAP